MSHPTTINCLDCKKPFSYTAVTHTRTNADGSVVHVRGRTRTVCPGCLKKRHAGHQQRLYRGGEASAHNSRSAQFQLAVRTRAQVAEELADCEYIEKVTKAIRAGRNPDEVVHKKISATAVDMIERRAILKIRRAMASFVGKNPLEGSERDRATPNPVEHERVYGVDRWD